MTSYIFCILSENTEFFSYLRIPVFEDYFVKCISTWQFENWKWKIWQPIATTEVQNKYADQLLDNSTASV